MSAAVLQKTDFAYIVQTPDVMSGEPRIDGHRIRVRDIALARDLGGLTPEEVAATVYPHLSLAQIYSALAYYEAHRDAIDAYGVAEQEQVEAFLREHPELVRDLRSERHREGVVNAQSPR